MKTLNQVLLAIACGLLAFGCGASSDHPTTATEQKTFKGGPMPADALKRFQDAQKKSAEMMADKQAKAKAAAATGGN